MGRAAGWGRAVIGTTVGLGLFLLAPAQTAAPQQAPSTPAAQQATSTPAVQNDYVGSEGCSDCHFAQYQQFLKTSMAVLLSEKYPVEKRGCEACHGPGRRHDEAEKAKREAEEAAEQAEEEGAEPAEPTEPEPTEPEAAEPAEEQAAEEEGPVDIFDTWSFGRHSPRENAARCVGCHQRVMDEKQTLFGRSGHLCINCHVVHPLDHRLDPFLPSRPLEAYFAAPQRAAEREWLANRLPGEASEAFPRVPRTEKQPKLCYSCHKEIEAQFQLPVRHRVNEGVVQCTDCHNPHGSLNAHELRAGNSDTCASCHVEKRGPFIYEHAAVRIEGCAACHTPHGSINLNLLKRRQQRQICLECHAPPEAVGVPHPRLGFQAAGECTRCHIDIHGSNYQKQFLR